MEISVGVVAALALAWAWEADVHWFERHWLAFYCVRETKTFRTILIARLFAAGLGLLLLLVVRPRLGQWAGATSLRDMMATVARVTIAVVLSLAVSEGVLQWKPHAVPGPIPSEMLPKVGWSETLLWDLEPSHTTTVPIAGRDIKYIVDANGFRVRSEREVLDLNEPTVLFVGESLAMGLAVQADETYAAMVGEDLHLTAVNAAVHGYGNDQSYLWMKTVLPRIPHLAAVVTVLLPGQLVRNVDPHRRRLGLRSDGTLEVLLAAPPSRLPDLELFVLFRTLVPYHDDESIRVTRAIFKSTAELARARGAVPLFVATHCEAPCLATDGDMPVILRDIFEPDHLSYVNVDLDPAWHVPTDIHPDVRGHRKIADAVEAALRVAKVGR